MSTVGGDCIDECFFFSAIKEVDVDGLFVPQRRRFEPVHPVNYPHRLPMDHDWRKRTSSDGQLVDVTLAHTD
ncbi:hypothetical protein [Mycolicibacterium baixiangningiae]|nr:hypothetical protein [Mycolicibacterium baixiangningiae]